MASSPALLEHASCANTQNRVGVKLPKDGESRSQINPLWLHILYFRYTLLVGSVGQDDDAPLGLPILHNFQDLHPSPAANMETLGAIKVQIFRLANNPKSKCGQQIVSQRGDGRATVVAP
jgi:hypothetical protein